MLLFLDNKSILQESALQKKNNIKPGGYFSIGNYDGLHKGHRAIFLTLKELANKFGVADNFGVITFSPSTKEFFLGDKFTYLTTNEQKLELLQELGIPNIIVVDFASIYSLTALEFLEKFLREYLQIGGLVVGEDFALGKGRISSTDFLKTYTKEHNIQFVTLPATKILVPQPLETSELPTSTLQSSNQQNAERVVSSSFIKELIKAGEIKQANTLLGRNYTIISKVIYGNQMGRTIGFPTANLEIHKYAKLYHGVYATKVFLNNSKVVYNSISNFGIRPTVHNEKLELLEVHLFDFEGNLYNQYLRVEFIEKIRAEQKFNSLEKLKTQISKDSIIAKQILQGVSKKNHDTRL